MVHLKQSNEMRPKNARRHASTSYTKKYALVLVCYNHSERNNDRYSKKNDKPYCSLSLANEGYGTSIILDLPQTEFD